jgi:hypothetical protein
MSPIRRRSTSALAALALGALLTGCFGSDSQEPTSSHRTRHQRGTDTSAPTEATSSPTTQSTPPTVAPLTFSPRSGGKHLDDCQTLVPGDDPAEFLSYPVLVKATSAVTLDTVATDHTPGVVDAGSWVAPAGATPETGTVKGWPPASIVTHDSNLRWGDRVRAAGAALDPSAGWYNLFLRLQVDPTPGDSATNGVVLAYHDDGGSHTITWRATTTFSMSC